METKNWTCAEADGCWNVYEESAEPGDKLVAEVYGFDPEGRARRISAVPELVEALDCILHRFEAEEIGESWAPIQDARALLARLQGEG